jgi:hypothetical protein
MDLSFLAGSISVAVIVQHVVLGHIFHTPTYFFDYRTNVDVEHPPGEVS